ncbi:hypothetical protein GCM10010156_52350 [Planobispora rosea]|uniref:Uncharacterized protein n=1 Tax=Planobispora rosea TaxID=35762 RepID=A0A8J3S650_PLARO|nr:hypothetical protein [Planobispora rosea]GGS87384.1 hypothetical protein GCM10010156_52350 [Planobispora rosea]GIH86637.1 hypothetical protein Pro02_50450 [Planobispora rosea]
MKSDLPEDLQRLRERLETIVTRARRATSWRDATASLRGLVTREGVVPIRTRLTGEDLDFLEGAREDLLDFATLGVRLLDLHQPRDAGGITSDTAHPILRCRSCMWRWPCPTFRAMSETFGTPREHAGSHNGDVPFSRCVTHDGGGSGEEHGGDGGEGPHVQVSVMIPVQPEGEGYGAPFTGTGGGGSRSGSRGLC